MCPTTSDARIAIVHERFTEIAGSEHVVEQLALQWPKAVVFAALWRPEGTPPAYRAHLTRRGSTAAIAFLDNGPTHR